MAVVPSKRLNKAERSVAVDVEGKAAADGNSDQLVETGIQHPGPLLPGLARVREAVRRDPKAQMVNLMHHITPALLEEGYNALKREALPGVDGVTWREYGEKDFREKLADLHQRVQSGRYRALPSKRMYIPKADGRLRPIGVAAIEDKIVQKATAWVMAIIYEEEFSNFSYGSRPGRQAHDALDAVSVAIMGRKVGWILDADIAGFFDTIDHQWMLKFLEARIGDKRILRLIRIWLRAGVSEDGEWSQTKVGTPQGAVISPLLANIYLHYVLDTWLTWWRKQEGLGEVYVVRYMDDFVTMFQYRSDATRFLTELRERVQKFGLKLHPDKTRLIEFGRFAAENREKRSEDKPETFNFLGFTHMCAKQRKTGRFAVWRHTIAKRMQAKFLAIQTELWKRKDEGTDTMGRWLGQVAVGYYRYFATPDNMAAVQRFRYGIIGLWRRVLIRRSQKARRTLNWNKMIAIAKSWIPMPTCCHPYPSERLRV